MEAQIISTVNWPACVIGLTLCVTGVALTFVPKVWSALAAFLGLGAIYFFGDAGVSSSQFYFWGAAGLIAWGIGVLLPESVAKSRAGVGYISGAALAGALVGMLISHAGMIIGAALGAFCGAMAYSRTPEGRVLEFPSSKFLHYLCAKGLPAIVSICIMCVAVAELFRFG